MASVRFARAAAALLLVGLVAWAVVSLNHRPPSLQAARIDDERKIKAPELDGGIAWLNSSAPLKIGDLKGKIVLLHQLHSHAARSRQARKEIREGARGRRRTLSQVRQ
jgi:hypothetical protein